MRDFDWFEPNTYELDKKGLSLTRWQLQRLAEEYTPEVVQRAIDSLNDIRPERMKAGTWACDYQMAVSACKWVVERADGYEKEQSTNGGKLC